MTREAGCGWLAALRLRSLIRRASNVLLTYIIMNCQTDHYTAMSGTFAYEKDFDKTYPPKEEDFTIKGLLRRVR
ncbi:MAG: hypothetical protein Q7R34_15440 [Dehalococcoidia bacterium]|nr:hypothetical protein [Dehalococcoidia bacterium]